MPWTEPTAAIDLDAYFSRIGYAGPRTPTLATLAAIQRHHTQSIAFENLSPVLGQPVHLDPASLQRKLVEHGRGGYCYEQNHLLGHVLHALGFAVVGLAARVLWGAADDAKPPRTHMLLRVDLSGAPCIVDVGFGGQVPTGPVRLVPGIEQATPHEPVRLVEAAGGFTLQAGIGDAWRSLYWFDGQPHVRADYEIYNYYFSTHPDSHFVKSLLVARPAPGRRWALRDNALAEHRLDGSTERRELKTAAELGRVLREVFGLALPDSPELKAALGRIVARAA